MQTQVDPVLSISGQAVMNLSDDSAFLSMATRYNASAERDIDVGYDHFLSDAAGAATDFVIMPGSEYGIFPRSLYVKLWWYF